MKFIWYEDLKKRTAEVVRELGSFVGKELTDEQIDAVVKATGIDAMRKAAADRAGDNENAKQFANRFFRKGEVGGWKDYFGSGTNLEEWDDWIGSNLKDTGMDITFE